MRRIEHLINDVKFSTNEQSNRFPNVRFNRLFNDAQSEIQRIVHNSSIDSRYFVKEAFQDIVSGQESYSLPSDIYTGSSVNTVSIQSGAGGDYYAPIRHISDKERRLGFGYVVQGSSFLLSPRPVSGQASGIRVNYTAKLAELSSRVGKIKSISNGVIKLSGYNELVDITDFNDYFSIVDKDGVLIDQDMYISSYDNGNGSLVTSSTITGSIGDYIVLGRVATTNSALPDACEKYMLMFVERMVHYINSSRGDLDAANVFSNEEKADIENLFAKPENDVKYPPLTCNNY